jgi:hypothetical protein
VSRCADLACTVEHLSGFLSQGIEQRRAAVLVTRDVLQLVQHVQHVQHEDAAGRVAGELEGSLQRLGGNIAAVERLQDALELGHGGRLAGG